MISKAALSDRFDLIRVKSGAHSLRSVNFQETFHPGIGPIAEAKKLHIDQQKIRARAENSNETFIIWDVGLGAAANAIATIESLIDLSAKIELHSFDINLDPLIFALENSTTLQYPEPHKEILQKLIRNQSLEIRPGFRWQMHLGDFRESLHQPLPSPDSIIYDPYSPATNPDMWSLEHFSLLRQKLNRPCLLTNYSRSTAVRVTWLLAGFFVGIGSDIGEKAETSIASNELSLLSHPLDHQWLAKVKDSKNSSPLRNHSYSLQPIHDADFSTLLSHPQFLHSHQNWDIFPI